MRASATGCLDARGLVGGELVAEQRKQPYVDLAHAGRDVFAPADVQATGRRGRRRATAAHSASSARSPANSSTRRSTARRPARPRSLPAPSIQSGRRPPPVARRGARRCRGETGRGRATLSLRRRPSPAAGVSRVEVSVLDGDLENLGRAAQSVMLMLQRAFKSLSQDFRVAIAVNLRHGDLATADAGRRTAIGGGSGLIAVAARRVRPRSPRDLVRRTSRSRTRGTSGPRPPGHSAPVRGGGRGPNAALHVGEDVQQLPCSARWRVQPSSHGAQRHVLAAAVGAEPDRVGGAVLAAAFSDAACRGAGHQARLPGAVIGCVMSMELKPPGPRGGPFARRRPTLVNEGDSTPPQRRLRTRYTGLGRGLCCAPPAAPEPPEPTATRRYLRRGTVAQIAAHPPFDEPCRAGTRGGQTGPRVDFGPARVVGHAVQAPDSIGRGAR